MVCHKSMGRKRGMSQHWRNWRREENPIIWQQNSRVPWLKHIRMNNDPEILTEKKEPKQTLKQRFTLEKFFLTQKKVKRNLRFTNLAPFWKFQPSIVGSRRLN